MGSLLNWIKGIMGCLLVMSLILQCVPGKIYRPYLRLFMGVVLILTVLAPLSEITGLGDTLDELVGRLSYDEVIPGWKGQGSGEKDWEDKLLSGEKWVGEQIIAKAEEMSVAASEETGQMDSRDESREEAQIARVEIDHIPTVKISGGE